VREMPRGAQSALCQVPKTGPQRSLTVPAPLPERAFFCTGSIDSSAGAGLSGFSPGSRARCGFSSPSRALG
jgi:hypothetical protein